MYYLCYDCCNVFKIDSSFYEVSCPNTRCEGTAIGLDENMLLPIQLLFEKGYFTQYCCSGHYWEDYSYGYIKFHNGIPIESAPNGWGLEKDCNVIRMISNDFKKKTEIERQSIIYEKLLYLYQWIDSLEVIIEEEDY